MKFFGKIGFSTGQEETAPGVWVDVVVARNYYGDVLRDTRALEAGESLNDDLTISNSFSIVADPFAHQHFHSMRYIEWAGVLWKVSNVEQKSPRLIIRPGGVWNGPKA